MKRDMDLIRQILIAVEEFEYHKPQELEFEGYSSLQVNYHIKLLAQSGFLRAHDYSSKDGELWLPKELTMPGHDFLDTIRNETVWNKVKQTVKEKGSGISLEVIKSLAVKISESYFLS